MRRMKNNSVLDQRRDKAFQPAPVLSVSGVVCQQPLGEELLEESNPPEVSLRHLPLLQLGPSWPYHIYRLAFAFLGILISAEHDVACFCEHFTGFQHMLSCFCLSTSCTSHVAVPVLHRCLKPNCNESECSWSPQMSKVQRSNSLRIREELAIAR